MVVLADDPRTCSEFVSAVVDLIRPVSFRNLNFYHLANLVRRYHLVVIADHISLCSQVRKLELFHIHPIFPHEYLLTSFIDFFLNGHEVVRLLNLSIFKLTNISDKIPFRHYLIGITNPFFLKRVLSQGKDSASPHVVYLSAPEVK